MDINVSDFVTREGRLHEPFEGCCKGDCIGELFEPNRQFLVGRFQMMLLDVI